MEIEGPENSKNEKTDYGSVSKNMEGIIKDRMDGISKAGIVKEIFCRRSVGK